MTKILKIDELSANSLNAEEFILHGSAIEDVIDDEVDERFEELVEPIQADYQNILEQNDAISAMIINVEEMLNSTEALLEIM